MKCNVIVYGLGGYFESVCKRGEKVEECYNIVGYCDRNDKYTDVYENYISPSELSERAYDFIIVTSIYYREIVTDLVEKYKVDCTKILIWEDELVGITSIIMEPYILLGRLEKIMLYTAC